MLQPNGLEQCLKNKLIEEIWANHKRQSLIDDTLTTNPEAVYNRFWREALQQGPTKEEKMIEALQAYEALVRSTTESEASFYQRWLPVIAKLEKLGQLPNEAKLFMDFMGKQPKHATRIILTAPRIWPSDYARSASLGTMPMMRIANKWQEAHEIALEADNQHRLLDTHNKSHAVYNVNPASPQPNQGKSPLQSPQRQALKEKAQFGSPQKGKGKGEQGKSKGKGSKGKDKGKGKSAKGKGKGKGKVPTSVTPMYAKGGKQKGKGKGKDKGKGKGKGKSKGKNQQGQKRPRCC